MVDYISQTRGVVTWTSPKGKVFNLKLVKEPEYTRKHVGTVKENPKPKKSTTKKITDSNDTFSDLGMAGRDCTLDFLFIGEKHDTESKAFETALCETGKSRLLFDFEDELTVNVLDFTVKKGLITNVNSTVISVNFHETSKTTYPKSKKSGAKAVKQSVEKTNTITAQSLADSVENVKNDTGRMQKFMASYSKMLNNVSSALSTANNISLNSIMTDIMGQNVMSNAFTMTSQLQIVMSKAANLAMKVRGATSDFSLSSFISSATGTSSIFGAWQTLIASLMTASTPTGSTNYQKSDIDNILINDVTASSAITAIAGNLVDLDFETRKDAVEAAKNLSDLEEIWTDFVEDKINQITDLNDTIIRDSGLNDVVSDACGDIINKSYELKVEKTIILSEDKTVIELAMENYPEKFEENPDETIRYLITSNNLSDDEFFLLKRGSEVKIYV